MLTIATLAVIHDIANRFRPVLIAIAGISSEASLDTSRTCSPSLLLSWASKTQASKGKKTNGEEFINDYLILQGGI
ncbi:hypothetical protein N7476_006111 [Penicillium atrosanguineum]|uniref:Uncharacterized protein n=1 Tax=Penicillium atrosanguineum TaxID=1132637 RepID=A0A9W9PYI3_9EURO|nr:hypothetical protein N7476_006111 [Penicillium atrosanguineum]